MGFILLYVIILIVVFFIIIVVLRKIFLSDTESAVSRLRQMDAEYERRQQDLKNMFKDAEKERQMADSALKEELAALREKAKKETEDMRKEMLEKAREESDNIIAAANSRRDAMRQETYQELHSQLVDCAGELLTTALSKEILESINTSLINELMSQLKGFDKPQIAADIKDVEVVFAESPGDKEEEMIKESFVDAFGQDIQIKVKQDQSLIAGAIVYLGSFVIDASLSNHLKEAAEVINKNADK